MRMAAIRSILIAFFMLALGSLAQAQIGVSITIAPPALPVYEQPICPGEGYLWTPGYWAYNEDGGYYWVPGTWVEAPEVGYLWTPPYWGWGEGGYLFHGGYWGPHVGFYGGISYGFGYFGNGYEGGRWDGGHFFYNRSVTNINVTNIHNVYNTTVINRTDNRVSYNGGNGGVTARPSAEEQRYDGERHVGPVAAQQQHIEAARANPQLRASANQGKPPVAATARPGEFTGREAVPAKAAGGEYHAAAENRPADTHANNPAANNAANSNRPANNTATNNAAASNAKPTHAKELTPPARNTYTPTGHAKADTRYQQQQQKLSQQQDAERTRLQQNQEKEDQRIQAQKDQQKQQQVEQRHAQQTQQLQERHQTQQTHLEQRAAPAQHESNEGRPK